MFNIILCQNTKVCVNRTKMLILTRKTKLCFVIKTRIDKLIYANNPLKFVYI